MFRIIVTLIILSGLSQPASRVADVPPGEAVWILAQVNALRQAKGEGALVVNAQLSTSAAGHSTYLATHAWSDPHTESNGSTPSSRAWAAGYAGKTVSENVVGGSTATKEWAIQWWINSPIHLYNMMLTTWTDVGVGVVDGPYGRFYTMDFGTSAYGTISGPSVMEPTVLPPTSPVKLVSSLPPGALNVAVISAADPNPTRAQPPTVRPTHVPTAIPTITLTPSITFTPHATFTQAPTATSLPPTMTAIVMEVSPQPPVQQTSVAMALTAPSAVVVPVSTRPGNDPLRSLIPFAILLQVGIVGGLIFRSLARRKR
jgi:Cysteine-rich secretory protein family